MDFDEKIISLLPQSFFRSYADFNKVKNLQDLEESHQLFVNYLHECESVKDLEAMLICQLIQHIYNHIHFENKKIYHLINEYFEVVFYSENTLLIFSFMRVLMLMKLAKYNRMGLTLIEKLISQRDSLVIYDLFDSKVPMLWYDFYPEFFDYLKFSTFYNNRKYDSLKNVIYSSVYLYAGLYMAKVDYLVDSYALNKSEFVFACILKHSRGNDFAQVDAERLGRYCLLPFFSKIGMNPLIFSNSSINTFMTPSSYFNWDCFLFRNIKELMTFNYK